MLTQICQYLRNWFEREKIHGNFVVSGGVLTYADGTALPLVSGQYFRVIGSLFNDGVHKLPAEAEPQENAETVAAQDGNEDGAADEQTPSSDPAPAPTSDLTDEPVFPGAVWAMAVPPDLVALSEEIAGWNTANAAALASPYQSESFGGYSYSLKSGGSADGASGGLTWQTQFAARLAPWRKI